MTRKISKEIKLNKLYNFSIEKYAFGTLTKNQICSLFKDGRVASFFLERQLEIWFKNLLYVNKNGYDFVNKTNDYKYDAKNFTRQGARFLPSNQIGAGRKTDINLVREHIEKTYYIFCDILDFPNIKVIMRDGKKLLKHFPNGKIPFGARNKLFVA